MTQFKKVGQFTKKPGYDSSRIDFGSNRIRGRSSTILLNNLLGPKPSPLLISDDGIGNLHEFALKLIDIAVYLQCQNGTGGPGCHQPSCYQSG